jgi:hypothetical protein
VLSPKSQLYVRPPPVLSPASKKYLPLLLSFDLVKLAVGEVSAGGSVGFWVGFGVPLGPGVGPPPPQLGRG